MRKPWRVVTPPFVGSTFGKCVVKYSITLFQIFLTEITEDTEDTEENKKFFLISQPLNHENTERNIGIYKLSP